MNQQFETPTSDDFDAIVGTVRRIGETGPIYLVLGPGKSLLKGRASMQIEFPESGEVIDYPVDDILEDRLEARCSP